jgi:hypothetical protein
MTVALFRQLMVMAGAERRRDSGEWPAGRDMMLVVVK